MCALSTMCSAIFLRMTLIGSMRTFSPGLNAGAGAVTWRVAAGALADAAGLAPAGVAADPPDSMKPRMSFFVTRPLMPVPWIVEMSTLLSLAMRRTSGDDFCAPQIFRTFAGLRRRTAGSVARGGRFAPRRSRSRAAPCAALASRLANGRFRHGAGRRGRGRLALPRR